MKQMPFWGRRRWLAGASVSPLALRGCTARADGERVLEQSVSDYNHIVVTERGSVRTMYFVVDGVHYIESRLDRAREGQLDLDYTRTMMAGFLVQPQVRKFLMVGFGGGQITNYLFRRFPNMEIDAVDIDPEVIRLARRYFDVPNDPRYRTHAADGRGFVEEAAASTRWDQIMLDAFRGVFVPYHLKTIEYYRRLRDHLTPGGVVVANLHSQTPMYPQDRNTFAAAFPHLYPFVSESGRQTAFVASAGGHQLGAYDLRRNADALRSRFDFDVRGLAARWYLRTDWNVEAEILRDDFEPDQVQDGIERHNRACGGDEACRYRTKD